MDRQARERTRKRDSSSVSLASSSASMSSSSSTATLAGHQGGSQTPGRAALVHHDSLTPTATPTAGEQSRYYQSNDDPRRSSTGPSETIFQSPVRDRFDRHEHLLRVDTLLSPSIPSSSEVSSVGSLSPVSLQPPYHHQANWMSSPHTLASYDRASLYEFAQQQQQTQSAQPLATSRADTSRQDLQQQTDLQRAAQSFASPPLLHRTWSNQSSVHSRGSTNLTTPSVTSSSSLSASFGAQQPSVGQSLASMTTNGTRAQQQQQQQPLSLHHHSESASSTASAKAAARREDQFNSTVAGLASPLSPHVEPFSPSGSSSSSLAGMTSTTGNNSSSNGSGSANHAQQFSSANTGGIIGDRQQPSSSAASSNSVSPSPFRDSEPRWPTPFGDDADTATNGSRSSKYSPTHLRETALFPQGLGLQRTPLERTSLAQAQAQAGSRQLMVDQLRAVQQAQQNAAAFAQPPQSKTPSGMPMNAEFASLAALNQLTSPQLGNTGSYGTTGNGLANASALADFMQAQQALNAGQAPLLANTSLSGGLSSLGIPGNGQEEVSTIFVVGFPDDMQEREFQNMFIFCPGFEAATLKVPPGSSSSQGVETNFGLNAYDDAFGTNSIESTLNHFMQQQQSQQSNPQSASMASRRQIIGFAKFKTRTEAIDARNILTGRKVDAERGNVLKAEMAKKNLHTKRGLSNDAPLGSATTNVGNAAGNASIAPLLNLARNAARAEGIISTPNLATLGGSPSFDPAKNAQSAALASLREREQEALRALQATAALKAARNNSLASSAWASPPQESHDTFQERPQVFRSQSDFMAQMQQRAMSPPSEYLSSGLTQSMGGQRNHSAALERLSQHYGPSALEAIQHELAQASINDKAAEQYEAASRSSNSSRTFSPPAGTQRSESVNPPCNTLYLGGLPSLAASASSIRQLEETLRLHFQRLQGFRRLCFRQKSNGPMCFVEFESTDAATRAMNEMNGNTLGGLVRSGIRVSFSKNPLFLRGPSPHDGGSVGSALSPPPMTNEERRGAGYQAFESERAKEKDVTCHVSIAATHSSPAKSKPLHYLVSTYKRSRCSPLPVQMPPTYANAPYLRKILDKDRLTNQPLPSDGQ
ncbi:hypothetical protein E5Q_01367 [Mixia osmundae IAM 14324]|uniref:RRM domain-containing protein n=2 Tax=Mixia osmundae (strain CBS 9802 / IAM 14324 / JCM 22182 / KY 12970) TaxID=764103 RepID=G7DVV4_MIXOS|nr:hypothetical protein E5Q_01367 [Mixia osmundae IAM 14324]